MDLILPVIITVIGITVLVAGGSFLIRGSVGISKHVGLSGFIIGMTVVAYGTSAPEFAASMAALESHPGIVLGNIAGSNIANVGLVSAVALMAGSGFATVWRTHAVEFAIISACSAVLAVLLLDGILSVFDGLALLSAFAISAFVLIRSNSAKTLKVRNSSKTTPLYTEHVSPQTKHVETQALSRSVIFVLLGACMLWGGSTLAVEGATSIGMQMGLSDHIIGITIIAIGTSLPELVTTIMAIRKKEHGMFLGNIIGSNIANIVLIGGASAILSGGLLAHGNVQFDIILAAVFTFVFIMSQMFGKSPRVVGIVLLISYVVWIVSSLH